MAVLSPHAWIGVEDVPDGEVGTIEDPVQASTTGFPTLAQLEERYVRAVLDKVGGKKDRAARILGINRRTLYRKEREFGWIPEGTSEEDWAAAESATLTRGPLAEKPSANSLEPLN
jgi:DNA-binding NtrC family response regulator